MAGLKNSTRMSYYSLLRKVNTEKTVVDIILYESLCCLDNVRQGVDLEGGGLTLEFMPYNWTLRM